MSRLWIGLLLLSVLLVPGPLIAQEVVPQGKGLRPKLALQIGHNLPVTSIAFSPDGRLLASGSRDATIKLWDVAGGALRRTLSGQKGALTSVAFSPDSKQLASTGSDGNIRLWDVATGAIRRTLRGHEYPTTCVAFSPDGKTVADGSFDSTVKIWDVAMGKALHTLTRHKSSVNAVAFSSDGKMLASGSMDRTIQLWSVATGKPQQTLNGHDASVTSLAFSPDGKLLASSSMGENGSGTIRLWTVASGTVRRTLTGHKDMVVSVAFSPDSKQLVSSSRDDTIKLWEVDTGSVQHSISGQRAVGVAFSPDGNFFASGDSDKTVKLWDAATGDIKHTFKGHQNLVTSVAISPDGKTLANGSWDKTIKLWDMEDGALRRTLSGKEDFVESVRFSPDGKLVAGASLDDTIRLWDMSTGALYHNLQGHKSKSWITSIDFSPDGKLLASSSDDGTIKLWDRTSTVATRTLNAPETKLITFSPDSRWLATDSPDEIIKIWDVRSGTVQRTLRGHRASITALAFSPDGKLLASGSADGTIKFWDMAGNSATTTVLHTLIVPKGVATSLSFSPDAATLASVGTNEITLWNVKTGAMHRTLLGHENLVLAVAFSPDGKRLVSGSSDTTIKIWEPSSGRLLATLLTLSDDTEETLKARPLSIGARAPGTNDEWFIITPEGWFDCSANAARFIRWNVGNESVPAERYYRRLRRPDLVRQALRGEEVPEPDLTQQDIPPVAQFVRLQYDGQSAEQSEGPTKTVTATLEVQGRHAFKEVIVLVNGRPLPPEQEQPLLVSDAPVDLTARPLSMGARPLSLGARALDINARPLSLGAREATPTKSATPPAYTLAKRYTFRVPLPVGAREIRLRAQVYDEADLGSNPTEITLQSPDAQPVAGNLYILCAGIGHYKNGSDGPATEDSATGFSNLKFPEADAKAIAARLTQENVPLYRQVEVFNGGPLLNEQATLENLRNGLKWLQQKGRPGQIDTVMVYLSGHGLSDAQGRYYFPTYEFDKQNWKNTSLSGHELQEALGGKLRARAVFLFADTCHSGALAGARSDDLNFEVNTSGVYMLASSSATQYSYESAEWGHGAFTLALLRSLSRWQLAQDGRINFNVLTYAVPDEIAKLMKEAGQNETAMAPVVPLDGRRLDEPVVQVTEKSDPAN